MLVGPLLASLVALAMFLVLLESPQLDPRLAAPRFHFWLVSLTSFLALVLAMVVAVVGARVRDARVVHLGAGFAGLAGFFTLHGLATPGFIIGPSDVTGVAAQLSVGSLAVWMFVAAYLRPSRQPGNFLWLLLAWLAVLLTAIALGLLRPEWTRFVPVDQAPLRWFATAVVLLLLMAAGMRFLEGYRLSRSGIHLVMLYVVGWVAVSQLIMVTGEVFQLSWWLYHALLLVAVLSMLLMVGRQLVAGRLDSGLRALLSDDAERRLEYGLRPEVKALVVATEAKDGYTAGHMQRVANYAVRLGIEMGVDPDDLRSLAQAGLVHDVGKIEVPDAVLNKPGSLSEDEFGLIRSHPVVGVRIGRELGMQRSELEIIRHHHERWDGTGYPDGLAGSDIPRLARILAVVDVHDAVTSDRSYRSALAADEALELIEEGAGTSFDPEVVAAWSTMQDSSRGAIDRQPAPRGDVATSAKLRPSGAE